MKPTPGKQYIIQDENSLSLVSLRAYGDASFWPRIWNANQTTLQSGNPDLIYPGEIIIIPVLPERQLPPATDKNKDPNGIYIDLDGYELRPQTARILRTLDTVANAFSVVIPWQPGEDLELDKRVRPKSFTKIKIHIGTERILTGVLYLTRSGRGNNGTTLTLSGESSSVDLVDSSIRPPYEFEKIKLIDLIKKMVEPDGFKFVNAVSDFKDEEFDRATATRGQSKFQFLAGLCRQRGVLLSGDVFDNVVLERAEVGGSPVGTFEENETPGVTGWGIGVNGRAAFNVYRAVGQSPFGQNEGKSIDNSVPRSRFKDVSANDSTAGNIDDAAEWARNKTIADALSFPLTVEGFRDVNGNLYRENTTATVISPSMFLENGFNFLINQVEYILNNNGRSSVLSFVPPTVYTKGEVIEPDSWTG